MRSLVALAGAAAVAAPALAQTPTFNDIVYANVLRDDGISMPVRLDVYWNNNVAPSTASPCVVWIHGGGWVGGTHDNVPQMVRTLLSSGFVVASASTVSAARPSSPRRSMTSRAPSDTSSGTPPTIASIPLASGPGAPAPVAISPRSCSPATTSSKPKAVSAASDPAPRSERRSTSSDRRTS